MKDITPFLMFVGEQHGKAKAAVELYISLFPNSSLERIELYSPGENEPEGSVRMAVFMPLDDYGFSRQFGWINDRFGVSWQLNRAA